MSSVSSERGEEARAGRERAPWGVEKRMCGMASVTCCGVESQEATGIGGDEEVGKARVVMWREEVLFVVFREFELELAAEEVVVEGGGLNDEKGTETINGSGRSSDQT